MYQTRSIADGYALNVEVDILITRLLLLTFYGRIYNTESQPDEH